MMSLTPVQEVLMGLRAPEASLVDGLAPNLNAAVDWIREAYRQAGASGISKGYSLLRSRWYPAYPETTGYTIPTLLNVAERNNSSDLRDLTLSLADFLLECATLEGGVAHWTGTNPQPIVFDTGQVMFGWLAAYEASGEAQYLEAAIRAGDWLASVQDNYGSWKKYQYLGVEKVIDTRVSWALVLLYGHSNDETHRKAAVRNLDWAVQQQDADGWYRHCAFRTTDDPFTHTLAYTAEGLFECGQLLGVQRYVDSARLAATALRDRQYADGHLASTYGPGWQETSRSSCLTGNCQMGRLWLRFYETYGDEANYRAAKQAITFVAKLQNITTDNTNIRGAIAGSHPIYGQYERFSYPNWAAKFFIDAVLTLDQVDAKQGPLIFTG